METKKEALRRHLLAGMIAAALAAPAAHAGGLAAVPGIGGKDGRALAAEVEAAGGSDRIIVKYREGSPARQDPAAAVARVQAAIAREQGVSIASGDAVQASHLRRLGVGADLIRLSRPLDARQLDAVLRGIAADREVEYAEPDVKQKPLAEPDDPDYAALQWHYHEPAGGVNLPPAWARSSGEGIVVAVLDTGIVEHEDLDTALADASWDFITDAATSGRDDDWRAPGAWDLGDWELFWGIIPIPSSWHGSHVAGTVSARTGNGLGGAGVAPGARVLPVRVLGTGGGYLSDIADAIYWASGAGPVGGGPGGSEIPANTAHKADVINLSLGGGGACGIYQDAIDAALAQNTAVVVAAGNGNNDVANNRPANCAGVIAVAANNRDGMRGFSTTWGTGISVSAPGAGVWSTINAGEEEPVPGGDAYASYSGTSMAAPHVAGVVALVQSAVVAAGGEKLSPAEIKDVLEATTRPYVYAPDVPVGTGIVNAEAAIAVALGEEAPEPPEPPDPVDPLPLASGEAIPVGVETDGQVLRYVIDVPENTYTLTIETGGGTGDLDLYVRQGSEVTPLLYDCRPYEDGNDETCAFENPAPGPWHVALYGFTAFDGATLTAVADDTPPPPPATLENGVPVTGIAIPAGEWARYQIEVPEDATTFTAQIGGGTGDGDLYVRHGEEPTTTAYDCRPYSAGNNETCAFDDPDAGTWYVFVRGYSAVSGLTLVATHDGDVGGGVTPIGNGTTLRDLSGAPGEALGFSIEVPEGAGNLRVLTAGGSGDVSLYLRQGEMPTVDEHDLASRRPGNNETVSVRVPTAGTWYALVVGETAFSRVTLRGSYDE
ncbi:S8 family serine peptidase [Coralloluteibacterium thermophilus]|uniref:S8 family serine peptidase n=1 Tax=Coralloluteibacterium thermophilum TaxID=2707049 RepID=A0ABV9NFR5_9GAMM